MEEILITTEFITLDQFLKFANIVASGGEAKFVIKSGLVKVNDEVEQRRGRKLYHGDRVEVEDAGVWLVATTESNQ